MAKSKLYTFTGDKGTTSLVGGERVAKTAARLEAYGTIDEFSSFLGVALSHRGCPEELKKQMLLIQDKLFEIGGHLATLPGSEWSTSKPPVSEPDILRLQSWIDDLDERTPKVNSFVLPGGTETSAHLHVARSVCRRAERRVLALHAGEPVDADLLRYLNRLSDYLFIAARYANSAAGTEEICWHPKG